MERRREAVNLHEENLKQEGDKEGQMRESNRAREQLQAEIIALWSTVQTPYKQSKVVE